MQLPAACQLAIPMPCLKYFQFDFLNIFPYSWLISCPIGHFPFIYMLKCCSTKLYWQTLAHNCEGSIMANGKQIQDTTARYSHIYVSPNKQLEIYACKRFISPKRARTRARVRHGARFFPPATVAIFIDTIGKNVCQVAADRLQMCAKCANDALSPSLTHSLCLSPTCVLYIWTYEFAAPIGSSVHSFIA